MEAERAVKMELVLKEAEVVVRRELMVPSLMVSEMWEEV
jgi:hypothetical protein